MNPARTLLWEFCDIFVITAKNLPGSTLSALLDLHPHFLCEGMLATFFDLTKGMRDGDQVANSNREHLR
jgi:hypothetical protein